MFKRHEKAEFIDAKSYPAVLRGTDAALFVSVLKSEGVSRRAGQAIAARTEQLHDAVLEYVSKLERAAQAGDDVEVLAQAHEIRGLAGTAGLPAAGTIANGLCRYFDALAQRGQGANRAVVSLHVDAIARAARAQDDATRLGGKVAVELAALAARKLGERSPA